MPPVLAAAAITTAGSLYASSQAKKASNSATRAQERAAADQLALQRETRDLVTNLNRPATDALSPAIAALMRDLGLSPSGGTGGQRAPAAALAYDAAGNVVRAPAPAPSRSNAVAAKAAGGFAGTSPVESEAARKDAERMTGSPQPQPVERSAVPAAAAAPQAPSTPAGPDWQGYLTAYPDVAAQAAREGRDPVEYAQAHYAAFGQREGRNLPMTQAQAPQEPDPAQTVEDPNAPPVLRTAARPGAAPMEEFGPRRDIKMGDYGAAPDLASYFDPSAFRTDPGYDFRVKEAIRGVNAGSAIAGRLRSGAGAKALQDRAIGLADQTYNNWFSQQLQKYQAARGGFESDRSFQGNLWNQLQTREDRNRDNDRAYDTSLWQFGVDRGDRNFDIDRGYQTNRSDNTTNNLFRLAGVGLQGAGATAGAATNYANAGSNIYQNQADAQAANAFNRGQANAYAANSIAGAAGNLFANWGGGSGGAGGGGYVSDLGRVNINGRIF